MRQIHPLPHLSRKLRPQLPCSFSYKSLESAIAKRLYRFLDKRFFHRSRWEFHLTELSWEHIGLSRNYDTANVKRKLRPAIAELERARFLKPLPDEQRFLKVRAGDWHVLFERWIPDMSPAAAASTVAASETEALREALIQRGVTTSTAESTVASHPVQRIQAQLEVFDWLVSTGSRQVSRNPPGFLVSAIRGEYAPPKGFVSRAEHARRMARAAERKRRLEERRQQEEMREQMRARAQDEAITAFWEGLSSGERVRMEREAMAGASPIQRDVVLRGGPLAQSARKAIFDTYALRMMEPEL